MKMETLTYMGLLINIMVKSENRTETLIEDKDGDINLYGITHKREVA